MKQKQVDYKYAIDKVIYKKLDNIHYIVVFGWCFHVNNEYIQYKAKINGKEMSIDYIPLKRMDVYNIYKKKLNLTNNMVGFKIQFDLAEIPVDFELFACQNSEEYSLLKMDKNQLAEVMDTNKIEYAIDYYSFDEEKELANVSGWAYSLTKKDIEYKILDEEGNSIEYTNQIFMRSDLVAMHMISQDQKFCGYRISFPYVKGKQYFIQFTSEDEQIESKLVRRKSSKRAFVRAYVDAINIENLRRGTVYLKRNGLIKFVQRLRFGPGRQSTYQDWFLSHRVNNDKLDKQKKIKFTFSPKISLIVATFNTKEKYLEEMIGSVLAQSYSNWELCIADGSVDDRVEKYVRKNYASNDKIKFRKLDDNYGISGNMNAALELATGDYVGLYDHDDFLEPDCLFEVVKSLQDFKYDLVYTDEDKFDDGKKEYVDPNFKPDYSEDLFRSHNYITHFFCVNKKIIDQVGAMNSEYDGAQDYDFMFRCIEKANGIYHVPKILYHWRMHPLSTAQDPESKMYCYEAGKKAIEDHYKRVGVEAKVELMPKPMYGMYHTIYSTKDNPLVSILIPNMNHKDVLKTCIDSLYNVNAYENFEVVIVENNSTEQEIFDYYEQIQKEHDNIKVITWKGEFNYSAINNFGAKYTKGDYILLLNNDTEMISKDALSEMLGCCMRPEVGAVGAKLLYEDDTVQHAGVVIGFGGYAGHVFNGIDKDDYGYMVRARINCNYSAVTAACMMVKKSVFEEVNGFDEQFKVACNDVDLCLKIRQKGYLIVYNAFALWHHYESKSRGYEDNKEKIWRFNNEVEKFQQKWPDILKNGDPYYNKNFRIELGPFQLE